MIPLLKTLQWLLTQDQAQNALGGTLGGVTAAHHPGFGPHLLLAV